MRESPNGMASASQADSRGFDSRLSLQKRPQKNSGVFFGAKLIEPQAHACYDLRQWHVLRLSVRARRALRPRGANSRLLLLPTGARMLRLTAMACPAPVGSGSKSLAPSRRKLPSPAPSHRRTHVTTYGNGMSCACRFGFEEPCALAAQTPVFCLFGCNPTIKLLFRPQPENFPIFM